MAVPRFDEKELKVLREEPARLATDSPYLVYDYPVTIKEAIHATYDRKPYWQIARMDYKLMCPLVVPDNLARGQINEAEPIKPIIGRNVPDMFGIEWEYIEQVGGAMVRPGNPFAEDANELLEKIKWPDPDKWDWEISAKANNGVYFKPETYNSITILNGWFERLISMLDFEGALLAIYDEDQKDAVHEFLSKLSDLYIRIIDIMLDTYTDVDGFFMHDDWGGQKSPFYSPELCAEMIVPHMRKVTDHIHSRGKKADLHSCGNIIQQVPNMITAGWDSWFPQPMNDSHKIYDMYGDKILVGVDPSIPYEKMNEDELRKAARDFADRFIKPGKPCLLSNSSVSYAKPFREELYSYSRKKCSETI